MNILRQSGSRISLCCVFLRRRRMEQRIRRVEVVHELDSNLEGAWYPAS